MERRNQLFSMVEPSDKLKTTILKTIKREEIKRSVYRLVFSSVLSLASIIIAFVYMVNIFNDFNQSGFSEYLSLIYSDGALLMNYWQIYVMSIVESLPIIPITILVASVWVFVWSANTMMTNLKNTNLFSYNKLLLV